ncbi:hypothetical protein [Flagellimonas myxillae]|uniref:hypothetical protein n=1 Tax=Flagellimonas myxillae TaxID=2942214 RepID=UPI00201EAECA|nr:hypothetical protein [Muricauda myxillae]MCL6265473.1 hypothetical protein [Muricauda myxillae]
MVKTSTSFIPYILSFTFLGIGFGQTSVPEQEYYRWFDTATGWESSNLFEGTLTTEKYGTLDGNHKYYDSNDYLTGHIVFDGATYFDVKLRYDIYEDELLLPLRSDSRAMMLKLVKERIAEFQIGGHRFIGVSNEDHENGQVYGFYEVLKQTSLLSLLKKHKKVGFANYKKNYVRYRFVDKSEYYVDHTGELFKIKNKKDILKIFPQLRGKLNKQSFESLRKKDMDTYLIKMIEVVHQFLSQKTL